MPRISKKTIDGYNRPFAVRLRQLLEERGLSQGELADKLKITRQAVNAYTLGTTIPDIDRLEKIADFFEVSCDFLLGRSISKKTEYAEISKMLGLSDGSIINLINLRADHESFKELMESGEVESDSITTLDFINLLLENEKITIWSDPPAESTEMYHGILSSLRAYFFTRDDKSNLYIMSDGRIIGDKEMDEKVERLKQDTKAQVFDYEYILGDLAIERAILFDFEMRLSLLKELYLKKRHTGAPKDISEESQK